MTAYTLTRYLADRDHRLVRAFPVYYGWIVVAAATVAMALTIPGQTAGLSLFIDALIADLGLSRSTISLGYTAATVLASFMLPWVGRRIDEHGPRRAIVVIGVLFSLACLWMGLVGGLITLFVGFVLLRGLGPGALSLVSLHAVNIWFVRRRGTAVGWMYVGLAIATAVFPLLIEYLLTTVGWRQAFFLVGAGLFLLLVPTGGVLFRAHPEQFGLRPDGDSVDDGGVDERVLTLAEARRTPIFWLLTLGGVCIGGFGTGLLFHHFSILAHNGMARDAAALLFLPLGVVTAMANLGTGVLVDRYRPRVLLGAMLLLFGAVLALLPLVTTPAAVWGYGSLFGLVQGMQGAILGSAYGHYFGRTHIGAIKGFTKTIFVAGTALGPVVYALGLDFSGSYTLPLLLTAPVPTLLGAAALWSGDE